MYISLGYTYPASILNFIYMYVLITTLIYVHVFLIGFFLCVSSCIYVISTPVGGLWQSFLWGNHWDINTTVGPPPRLPLRWEVTGSHAYGVINETYIILYIFQLCIYCILLYVSEINNSINQSNTRDSCSEQIWRRNAWTYQCVELGHVYEHQSERSPVYGRILIALKGTTLSVSSASGRCGPTARLLPKSMATISSTRPRWFRPGRFRTRPANS